MQTKTKKQLLLTLMLSLCSMAYIVSNSVLAFADQAGDENVTSGTMNKLVGWGATIAGGLIAVFLMVSIVKDAIGYAKGQGSTSVFKIIGKVIFMIIMIGIIFLARNYGNLGNKGSELANKGMSVITNEVNTVIPGSE